MIDKKIEIWESTIQEDGSRYVTKSGEYLADSFDEAVELWKNENPLRKQFHEFRNGRHYNLGSVLFDNENDARKI